MSVEERRTKGVYVRKFNHRVVHAKYVTYQNDLDNRHDAVQSELNVDM